MLGTESALPREKSCVIGRWHDNQHTLIRATAWRDAGDQSIMDIAGHVSGPILARYARGAGALTPRSSGGAARPG
jgi:hypothetical protein